MCNTVLAYVNVNCEVEDIFPTNTQHEHYLKVPLFFLSVEKNNENGEGKRMKAK
jgi:hypothetical protein